jgi:hypothetical protein
MKYASLSLITLYLCGAFAIGCGSSRPHSVDVDSGPGPQTDMGPGHDSGPSPGTDMGITPPRDTGPLPPHDTGPLPPHDSGGGGRMCTPSCTSDAQCQGTCPNAPPSSVNCCMAGHCYVSHTAMCPAPVGHDSGSGGCGGG